MTNEIREVASPEADAWREEVPTSAGPRHRAAMVRLEDRLRALAAGEPDPLEMEQRLAALPSSDFSKVAQATTFASKPLDKSPGHISQEEMNSAFESAWSEEWRRK